MGGAENSADTFFRVGPKKLRFGEVLALAGDYYAHLDAP